MTEEHFCTIEEKLDDLKFSSMKYLRYDEISDYEVQIENDNIILIYGFNREAKMYEYHLATNAIDVLQDKQPNGCKLFPMGKVIMQKEHFLPQMNVTLQGFIYIQALIFCLAMIKVK